MRYGIIAGYALGALVGVGTARAADTYIIDPTHTYPNFVVDHLGFSTMHGRFNDTTGKLVLDREGGKSSVDVTINTVSIDTGHGKRDDHLRNSDFFNVEQYPTMVYKSRKVTFQGEDKAVIDGDLTLLGVTKPVQLQVDRINCGTHPLSGKQVCGFNAIAQLKRSDFGMNTYLPAIGDRIDIRLEAEAVKQ